MVWMESESQVWSKHFLDVLNSLGSPSHVHKIFILTFCGCHKFETIIQWGSVRKLELKLARVRTKTKDKK